ncbi:MAG TPA: ImmA/IrrE family metallo-endopeptidase [Solirubrobacteraceae bacterium]|jgi:Zn-dependent peptidase ImmA (M78 family)
MPSQIKTEAADEAAKLLEVAWEHRSIPVDPIAIARSASIEVLEAALDENTLGALIKEPGAVPKIVINERHPETRKRFTCAHELGHWTRRGDGDEEYTTVDLRNHLSSTGDDPEEVFANGFAAALLMPEAEFRLQYALWKKASLLGIRFKVSQEAAEFRIKHLNLGLE